MSPFKKPPNSSAYPTLFRSFPYPSSGVRDQGLQRAENLWFLCPQARCPKRDEPPFALRDLRSLIPLTVVEAVRRISGAPRRPLLAGLYLQTPLTSSSRSGRRQSNRRRPSPQSRQLGAAAPRRACVCKTLPPRRRGPRPQVTSLRSANGLRPRSAAAMRIAGAQARPCVLTPSYSRSRERWCTYRLWVRVVEAFGSPSSWHLSSRQGCVLSLYSYPKNRLTTASPAK